VRVMACLSWRECDKAIGQAVYSDCMQEFSDEQLVARAADDARAVDELFGRYQTRVAAWCFRVARDREWAADLAQEVFLRALRSLPGFRGDAKFSTWLYTIARNHCYNAVQSRATRAEDSLEFLDPPDAGRRFDHELEVAGQIKEMRELVNTTLDETERQVMTLHFGEEMTLDSVTQMLGLSNASGAKAYVVSARRKLKGAIARMRARSK
jgi:RNA polymerase sigma-70 factor (ECF subfamily)